MYINLFCLGYFLMLPDTFNNEIIFLFAMKDKVTQGRCNALRKCKQLKKCRYT